MDVNSGEILAFVSTPSYDSNDFAQGVGGDFFRTLLNDEKKSADE